MIQPWEGRDTVIQKSEKNEKGIDTTITTIWYREKKDFGLRCIREVMPPSTSVEKGAMFEFEGKKGNKV